MSLSRLVILPYKLASRSAKCLATLLGEVIGQRVRRVRPDGLYQPKANSLIINYGYSQYPRYYRRPWQEWLNDPPAVNIASNKLLSFQQFTEKGIVCPEWTTDMITSMNWTNSGNVVLCRTLLNSHSGRGIVLADAEHPPLNACSLYVKYKKKRKEFRLHVFQGKIIDVAEKRKVQGWSETHNEFCGAIRNHANGWIFAREGMILPQGIETLALDAIAALGLDFGACDIIWNEHENKCYILEVNTAPGLEGTTLISYVKAIYNWYRNQLNESPSNKYFS